MMLAPCSPFFTHCVTSHTSIPPHHQAYLDLEPKCVSALPKMIVQGYKELVRGSGGREGGGRKGQRGTGLRMVALP